MIQDLIESTTKTKDKSQQYFFGMRQLNTLLKQLKFINVIIP